MDNQCYEETDGERCSGSDEPTADNAEHTRNAEYRRITSPGTVGKRCTHGYHKGDVSGGKGKFQGSSQGDEQTSQYEIDGGANQVKSGAVGYDGFILLEACVHPPLAAFGHRFGYSVSQSHAEAYQRTGYRGTSEVLFTVILAGKVHGSLDNVVGFLGCAECIDHDSACTDKEIPRGFGGSQQGGHQEAVRISSSVGGIVHKRGISCEGDTDKVHQVIAGKGKSEGESTHKNHYFEDIYLAPMQYLHQYGEEYKETGYQQCGIVVYPLLIFRSHE